MARISKKELESKVTRINEMMGRPVEPFRAYEGSNEQKYIFNVGHIALDYNRFYGGYTLREISNRDGGESNFGLVSRRVAAREMNTYLEGIITGLKFKK